MVEKKITLEELAILNDGTHVDLEVFDKKDNSALGLLKDDIEDFMSKPKLDKEKTKYNFYSTIPNSSVKSHIEEILKRKNITEEIQKRQAQHEFDAKMARIRKIKSKTYRKMKRKDKMKKAEALENSSNSDMSQEAIIEDDIANFKPIISLDNIQNEESSEELSPQQQAVSLAFDNNSNNDNEKEFVREKSEIAIEEAPKTVEYCLPGWDTWAGEGLEFTKNKVNTIIENKAGIRIKDREDYGKKNVIINENIEIKEKYLSKLPYGYTYKDYKSYINTPVSLETNSLRVFNKFVKFAAEEVNPAGKNIIPHIFDPECE